MDCFKTYHFVLTKTMRNNIYNLSLEKKIPVWKTIMYILTVMLPVLNYQHLIQKESNDYTYPQIDAETEIKFKISRNVYRKLKNFQGTIHTFSVAVIVRRMIELFFKYKAKRKLNKLKRVIRYLENKIESIKKMLKPYKKKHYMVHMYDDETNLGCIKLIFSNNYTLLGFQTFP